MIEKDIDKLIEIIHAEGKCPNASPGLSCECILYVFCSGLGCFNRLQKHSRVFIYDARLKKAKEMLI